MQVKDIVTNCKPCTHFPAPRASKTFPSSRRDFSVGALFTGKITTVQLDQAEIE